MPVRQLTITAGLLLFLGNFSAGIAAEGGLGGALQEARLVSSYYQFARHCQVVGAISQDDLMAFRQRLLDAVFEKYGLGPDEELQVIGVVEDVSVEIATAELPVTPQVCAGFIGSI